ncbi:MAG: helicase, partial [Verrucomicrobia bacterium]|nr:helicase [Verrucomicrobiota bacterium]
QPRQVRFSAEILFRVLREHEPEHPLLREAYRQATEFFLDAPRAFAFLDALGGGAAWEWRWVELRAVSPFGFPLFASRMREALTLESPEEAIERLYQQLVTSAER